MIDNSVDVDDLRRGDDFLEVLLLAGWLDVLRKRFLTLVARFGGFSGSFVFLLVRGGWLTSGLRPPGINRGAEQH